MRQRGAARHFERSAPLALRKVLRSETASSPSVFCGEKSLFSFLRWQPSLVSSHLFRCFDSQQAERADKLRLHQFAQPHQKGALLLVRFRQDVMLVIEIVERLRPLKR